MSRASAPLADPRDPRRRRGSPLDGPGPCQPPEPEAYWSPQPIVGFRHWNIDLDCLRGATGTRWSSPEMWARCLCNMRVPGPVPHPVGRCSPAGCGIFAVKHPDLLRGYLRPRPWPSGAFLDVVPAAFGVVSLSGRVVEHAAGYRAAHARAVGMVAVVQTWITVVTEPGRIEALFADPLETLVPSGRLPLDDPEGAWRTVAGALIAIARREEGAWT